MSARLWRPVGEALPLLVRQHKTREWTCRKLEPQAEVSATGGEHTTAQTYLPISLGVGTRLGAAAASGVAETGLMDAARNTDGQYGSSG